MPFPDLKPHYDSTNDRIVELEEAGVTTDELQARVIALRLKDPTTMTDAELVDACACAILHRRTTSGPPKAKTASKKIDAQQLLGDF